MLIVRRDYILNYLKKKKFKFTNFLLERELKVEAVQDKKKIVNNPNKAPKSYNERLRLRSNAVRR